MQLALLYPALLALVSLGIIIMLMTYVMPDIIRVFTSRGADLPLLTRALIVLSEALRAYGLAALALLALALVAFRRWLRAPANRTRFHRLLAQSRLTARYVTRVNSAQFTGTLATLVQSRVPLVEALAAAARRHPEPPRPPSVEAATLACAKARACATRSAPPGLPADADRDDRQRRGRRQPRRDARPAPPTTSSATSTPGSAPWSRWSSRRSCW